jgi:hypothetical protein
VKREVFQTRGLLIETAVDFNGRYWIAWKPHVSCWFRVRADLMRWCGYPTQTPTRASLLSWLDSLEAADAAKGKPANLEQDDALLKETGFGPEVFEGEEEDPALSTKMVL